MTSSLDEERGSGASGGDDVGIGPQHKQDASFRARMRFHQSWWRANVLNLPFGKGPKDSSTAFYGNMLRPEDGEQGHNFLTPQIFDVAKRRLAEKSGALEPFRLRNNLLSSQPMCFNLFGPLVDDPSLATRLFRALQPEEVEQVTRVEIEYAPRPISAYLNDRTAFDAFVAYRRPDGSEAFLGIETKLADTFSPRPYKQDAYEKLTERHGSIWTTEAWPELSKGRWNQLWRNHLLVEVLRAHQGMPHGPHGKLMLVRHPRDSECEQIVAEYRGFLVDPASTFIDAPLDRLIETWRAVLRTDEERGWLERFCARYLDLGLSDDAWRQCRLDRRTVDAEWVPSQGNS